MAYSSPARDIYVAKQRALLAKAGYSAKGTVTPELKHWFDAIHLRKFNQPWDHNVGDIAYGGFGVSRLQHLLAGLARVLDDKLVRPFFKLSPVILGGLAGWLGTFTIPQWIGIGLVARYVPGYLGKLAQGVVVGAVVHGIWKIDWSKAGDAFGSLGTSNIWRYPGGTSGGF